MAAGISDEARGECPSATHPDDLTHRLDDAEGAFASLDVDRFSGAMDGAALTVECLDALVTPPLAARYHRLVGLDQFVSRDEAQAELAFAAARSVEPEGELPLTLVPEGHDVRLLFTRYDLSKGRTDHLPPPDGGSIVLDGTEGLERPAEWPVLVQLIGPTGAVTQSAYLFPGDPMLEYTIDPAYLARARRRTHTRAAMFGTAVLAAVGSGFVYGLAEAQAKSFGEDHPDWHTDDLDQHRARTNALVGVSAGLAVVAVGTGATGIFLLGPVR